MSVGVSTVVVAVVPFTTMFIAVSVRLRAKVQPMTAHSRVEVDSAEVGHRRIDATCVRPFEYPFGLIFQRGRACRSIEDEPRVEIAGQVQQAEERLGWGVRQISPSMVSPKLTGRFVIADQEIGNHS